MRSLADDFRSSQGRWNAWRLPMWRLLIAILGVVAVLQTVCDFSGLPGLLERTFALSRDGMLEGKYWQLLTYMFLHGAPGDLWGRAIHLLVNALGIYWFGREVEATIGRRHFLCLYICGGLLGALAHLALAPAASGLVGASAGVFALLLAFTTIMPDLELTVFLFFFFPVKMQARTLAITFVVFSLVCLFAGIYRGVAHIPHLAGCLAGWLYARGLGFGRPLPRFHSRSEVLQREARWEKMPTEEFINREIDPILDKISREGIQSLTREERRILDKGRDRIARKVTPKMR